MDFYGGFMCMLFPNVIYVERARSRSCQDGNNRHIVPVLSDGSGERSGEDQC